MILVLKSLQYAGTVNRHNVCKLSRPSSSGSKKKRKQKKKKKKKENKKAKKKKKKKTSYLVICYQDISMGLKIVVQDSS